ncbi:MAG TPA: hypothetical protein DEQ74_03105 [Wolbachia sp.]|uniref:hypothetical protein n=1 Tax=Wolbachia endosymbiont of Pentalonia nigronervosa TaxID=1301914 RepID=UPI000EBE6857|nr:hypothetical protein [Wolbachia endosymbiont of Pentalonia nigronervosa]MBD0391038.1 hypothetical protein [Wolbachia endosymbiont of Pentalonia nigronervosa]HCE59791.1 hypothetical protein [Wolbachia sp.]
MAKKGIRDYLYQAIALILAVPFYAILFPSFCCGFLFERIEKAKISKPLKFIILAPLVILFLLITIPSVALAGLISSTLTVISIALFPEFFFSLWIKERVGLSRVLSTHFISQCFILNFESFLEVKNNNRKLLVELLKSNNLNALKVIFCHKEHPELIKNVNTEIHDEEKSKIILDYLELSNFKSLFVQRDLHEVYKACKDGIKVINDIDIGLLKTFFKLDRYSPLNSSRDSIRLFNVILLLNKYGLANNISETLSSSNQSSVMKVMKYFLSQDMNDQDFNLFTSMLKDKNVFENLKRIDNINNTLPGILEFEDSSSFLNLSEISYDHITHFFIDNLYSLLSNNKLFDKFNSIPTKVLKDICNTELYKTCKSIGEVLAFFDCLYDNRKNKNIIDNLKTAFETDSEVTHALLNNELFNSQDEVSEVMRHENFDGSKVREILNRANLVQTLRKNALINASSREKTICIFNLQYVIHLFHEQIKTYLSLNEMHNDQKARKTFFNSVDLFRFFLRETEGCRYEKVLSIIKDTKFEHFKDGRFISQVGDNLKDYFSHLLIFQGALFSDISNEFRLRVMYILFPLFRPERGPQSTMETHCEEIFKMKFVELFIKQKYKEITQESLEKIQNLTIEDLLKIPGIEEFIKMEEIEKFLHTKGITNSSDLSLLAELIENSIHIADEINNKLNSEESKIQIICDVFQADPHLESVYSLDLYEINVTRNVLKRQPPSLLNLCKTNIIRSSLNQQTVSN